MAVNHHDELRREIAAGRVTAILGAGVSIAATGAAPTASWIGLLADGIDRCVAVVPGLSAKWPDRMRDLLDLGREGDNEALLSVAELITVKLGGPSGGEMRRWLRETVGELRVRHPDVPRSLGELGIPLLTTNYDDILEDATHLRALDWRDTADVERVLRGEDRAVVHLHGYWRRPENLVLGVRSYEDVVRDQHAQTVLRSLRMTKTLLFVGFGAGLDDPNFGALLRWTREVFAGSEVRHYRLALAGEVEKVQAQHKPEERVFVLSYGEKHADLAPYLTALAPEKRAVAPGRASVAVEPDATPRPRILVAGPFFGVPKELKAEILRIWRVERKGRDVDTHVKVLARIRAKLRAPEVRHAQLAAILRYDVILDLSPWRAFASRWSLGLRDVERERTPREGAPVPLLYILHSEGELPAQGSEPDAAHKARLLASRRRPSDLSERIDELIGAGIAMSGFESTTWAPIVVDYFSGGPVVADFGLGPAAGRIEYTLASEPLDEAITAPSLDDYLRALRVTAGQVTLAGETTPRPICDVYVELDIQREEKQSEQARSSQRGDGEQDKSGALREEIEASRKAAWDVPGSELIPASAIHEVARRILLWGPAGTGKSTLLRHLACKVADEGRIPLWIPRLVELGDNLSDELAGRALLAVGLPDGPSPARTQLREAVDKGQAFLFLDGFDEAPTSVRLTLPRRVRDLPPEMRVVIASRPLHRMHTGLVEITLTGLPITGAEELLGAYFKDEPWIAPLLRDLALLPDGTTWLRNPVLLGLAASVYRRDHALPDATLDLYEGVIENLLAPLARTWPLNKIRDELRRLARKMLLPAKSNPTVTIQEGKLPYAYREALLASGLFTGDEWLRFTHLTLGEYLAASSFDFDFAVERERERGRPEGRAEEESALEVLPMAHALFRDETELVNAFDDACDPMKETPGHRLLRLVLRTIGYGGKAVRAFCEKKLDNGETWGVRVLAVLARRLMLPSGRFGEFERRLMADAERAFVTLRRFVEMESSEKISAQFAPILATRGEAGTEAHIALWNLGVKKPTSRASRWWETIRRQARALVRAGVGVDELIKLTTGNAHLGEQDLAVDVLGKYSEYWPKLRPLLDEGSERIREDAVRALAKDSASVFRIRERLDDDEGRVRMAAVHALAHEPAQRTANLDRLLQCITDKHEFVRAAAVRQLIDEPEALPQLRKLLVISRTRHSDHARGDAIEKLINDPEARPAIQDCIDTSGNYLGKNTLKKLLKEPSWRPLVRHRLEHVSPDHETIEALAGDVESIPRIRELLYHKYPHIRLAAIKSLVNDTGSSSQILKILGNPEEEGRVRAACVAVVRTQPKSKAQMLALLEDVDAEVRCAAIESLEGDPSAISALRDRLQDPEFNVRRLAIGALGRHPFLNRDVLWGYFNGLNEYGSGKGRWDSFERVAVIQALGKDVESRTRVFNALVEPDQDYEVCEAAANVLLASGPPDDQLLSALRQLLDKNKTLMRRTLFGALSDDRAIREQLLPELQNDAWAVRLVGFRLLVASVESRDQILNLLRSGPDWIRVTTVEPLAHVRTVRESLYPYLSDPDDDVSRTMMSVLRRDPNAKRHLRQALAEGKIDASPFDFTLAHAAQVLADDPEAHPILLERISSEDNNVVAALIPALANYPAALPRLREILDDIDRVSNERAAAVEALAGDPESRVTIVALLYEDRLDKNVLSSVIKALADDLDARPRIQELFTARSHEKVRRAALKVLVNEPSARDLLRSRLAEEDEDDIREGIIEALAGDPQSIPLIRERLRDPSSGARLAAVKALRLAPVTPATALAELPSVRFALHLAGSDSALGTHPPSLPIRDRLEAFVKSPRSLNLDHDPAFAEAILGWLCARLCWAAEDGAFRNGRVFGEVKDLIDKLLGLDVLVIRVAMDSSELPRERFLHPAHNLIEAWRVATHLFAAKPPAIFLACADVDFEHLIPPELAPGEVFWGPGFFGFRLREARTTALDPLELLASSEARDAWQGANEETKARYVEMMSRLANLASLDPWAVVPLLSRVGDLLPLSVQAAFAQRLPRAMNENVLQLEQASRSLGSNERASLDVSSVPRTRSEGEPSALVKLHAALDIVRPTLDGSGPIEPAIEAFEQTLGSLASGEIPDADRDNAVMLLTGLRDRTTTRDQAKRVLAVATAIDDTKLSRGMRRRLYDLKSWLQTWRV